MTDPSHFSLARSLQPSTPLHVAKTTGTQRGGRTCLPKLNVAHRWRWCCRPAEDRLSAYCRGGEPPRRRQRRQHPGQCRAIRRGWPPPGPSGRPKPPLRNAPRLTKVSVRHLMDVPAPARPVLSHTFASGSAGKAARDGCGAPCSGLWRVQWGYLNLPEGRWQVNPPTARHLSMVGSVVRVPPGSFRSSRRLSSCSVVGGTTARDAISRPAAPLRQNGWPRPVWIK